MLCGIHSLPEIILDNMLAIPISDETAEWTKREVLTALLEQKSNEIGDKYSSFGFHFVLGTRDPTLLTVLQVVDDSTFSGQRRNNILSYDLRYCGIASKKIKNESCVYLNFAK